MRVTPVQESVRGSARIMDLSAVIGNPGK